MELELKHLAPYLPYGLNVRNILGKGSTWTLTQFNIEQFSDDDKPILKPLSDLTDRINPIQHHTYLDGLNYPNIDSVENALIKGHLFIEDYQYLIENHFDVFGLIEKGLAVDVNTL